MSGWHSGPPSPARLADQVTTFRVYPARHMPRDLRPSALEFRLYFQVRVFSSRAAMVAFSRWRLGEERDGGRFAGQVIPLTAISFRRRRRWVRVPAVGGSRPIHVGREARGKRGDATGRLRPRLGELLLHQGVLGTACICHEAVHLATSTLRALYSYMGDDSLLELGETIDAAEERLAYLTGELARQVVDNLYAAGLYAA